MLAVTDDLPTPPLPLAMEMTLVRDPGRTRALGPALRGSGPAWRRAGRRDIVVVSTSTLSTPPTALTASAIARPPSSCSQPGAGMATSTRTVRSPVAATPSIMSSSARERRRSGSTTAPIAASTDARSIKGLLGTRPENYSDGPSRLLLGAPVDTRHFESTLGDLAAILGDPTRRGIYLAVREAAGSSTVSLVAESFGIHPNVARHHLERLVAEGYLEEADPPDDAGRPRRAARPGTTGPRQGDRGQLSPPPLRPARRVAGAGDRTPRRRGAAPAIAEEIGFRFGTDLAAETGLAGGQDAESALKAVSGALETLGFGMAPDPADRSLLTSHCPFGATATNHPEIVCRIDQGIVRGLMEAARGAAGSVVVSPHEGPDESCLTEV